jgi:hypothetical protein
MIKGEPQARRAAPVIIKNELSYILHKQIVGGQAYGLALLQGRADAINKMPYGAFRMEGDSSYD